MLKNGFITRLKILAVKLSAERLLKKIDYGNEQGQFESECMNDE